MLFYKHVLTRVSPEINQMRKITREVWWITIPHFSLITLRAVNLSVAKQVFYAMFQIYSLNLFNVNYIARRKFPWRRAPPFLWKNLTAVWCYVITSVAFVILRLSEMWFLIIVSFAVLGPKARAYKFFRDI